MDASVTPCTMIPAGIVTPYPMLAISIMGTTHATPQTGTSLAPATPTTLHKDLSLGMSSNAQDLNSP